MKMVEIFNFELTYQLGKLRNKILLLILFGASLLLFFDYIPEARSENSFINAPTIIGAAFAFMSMLSLLLICAICGDAGARDRNENLAPLIYCTPVNKKNLLFGRLLALNCIALIPYLFVPLSLFIIKFILSVETELFGAVPFSAYGFSFLLIGLPNVFFVNSILFSLVIIAQRRSIVYFGGVFLFLLSFILAETAVSMGSWEIAKITDFSGRIHFQELKLSLSPITRNTAFLEFSEILLNRFLWICVSVALLVWAYKGFSFSYKVTADPKKNQKLEDQEPEVKKAAYPVFTQKFDWKSGFFKMWKLCVFYLRTVVKGWGLLVLPFIVTLICFLGPELLEGQLGVPFSPAFELILKMMNQLLVPKVIMLMIVFYSGELLWHKKEIGMEEIMDSTPTTEKTLYVGKFLALIVFLLIIQSLLILTGIALQLGMETDLSIGLFIMEFYGFQMVDYLLFSILAFFIHVLINNKYLGYGLLLISLIYIEFSSLFGVYHPLLIFGSDLGMEYSAMKGYDSFLPWLSFKFFWLGLALIIGVLTLLLWVRGRENKFAQRINRLKRRRSGGKKSILLIGIVLLTCFGSYAFYHMNIKNDFGTYAESMERRADYEKFYGKYRNDEQPHIISTYLEVDIYPKDQEVKIAGNYQLKNSSAVQIDTIHLATANEVEMESVNFNRASEELSVDYNLGHSIYKISPPLNPGDSIELKFELKYQEEFFTSSGAVEKNGTYFSGADWLPAIGYQAIREINQLQDREEYGLSPRPVVTPLEKAGELPIQTGREKIKFEAVIGTSEGQTAVTSGTLVESWSNDSRNYFHYKSDTLIRNGFDIFSAEYEKYSDTWEDVKINVYHHPSHEENVGRIVQGVKASLEYFTNSIAPYPYSEINFVEHPGKSTNLKSNPISIAFSEGFAYFDPENDERGMDFPFSLVAHEVAHQWWGNQLIPANVEGASLLSEALAWYSAMMIVKDAKGEEELNKILATMRQSYLTPRSGAGVPLVRAVTAFDGYRKGPFAMYSLYQHIGEEKIDEALQALLKKKSNSKNYLAVAPELIQELRQRTPDSLQYLISDLFERNVYWDLKVAKATAVEKEEGKWKLEFSIEADKKEIDSVGVGKPIKMKDLIKIRVLGQNSLKPIYSESKWLKTGENVFSVVIEKKPHKILVDPDNILIDRSRGNNIMNIQQAD